MTTGERIRELRNELTLTQTEFGDRVGLRQSSLGQIESGVRNTTDRIVKLICAEFNVSENWLRTGAGEMFVQSASGAIDQLAREYHLDELDIKVLSAYVQLNAQNRTALKAALLEMARAIAPEESEQMTIDEEVEAYRLELEAERKGATLPPSGASGA